MQQEISEHFIDIRHLNIPISSKSTLRAAAGSMISSLFKKPSDCLFGATFILLGIAAAPSQATTLSGFETYGDMMIGMRVTANFLDGTSQTVTWGSTGKNTGGAYGSGWSLIESGDTYNSPWTFSNTGQGISSLIIDAIPGNTLFDNYPPLYGPLQTPGSAEGWPFQTLVGQAPNSYRYSDDIDISHGDLFGTLSAYWNSGFTGTMQFRADTDSGTAQNPVQVKDPVATYTPPTVYLSTPTIYEGQSAAAFLAATEPNENAITFFLNGGNLGTTPSTSGTRSTSTNLGFFADNGVYTYTAQARDEKGNYSIPVTSTLTVLNVPPTITSLNIPTIYEGQSASAYISATDPGADSISFSLNGSNVGTDASTSGTRSVNANLGSFADNGYIPYTAEAVDKDGGVSTPVYGGLTVLNVPPTLTRFKLSKHVIDEGQSVLGRLFATDPGADYETFFVNGNNVGTDLKTSGTRSVRTDLGIFDTPGKYTFTGVVQDKDGAFSQTITKTIWVKDVPPTITQLTGNLSVNTDDLFDFSASATDPGTNEILTYSWDLNGDGLYDDFTGLSGEWSFEDAGTHQVGVQVCDNYGGCTDDSFIVETTAPQAVPEPGSALGVLVFGVFGAGAALKRKQQRKTKELNLKSLPR